MEQTHRIEQTTKLDELESSGFICDSYRGRQCSRFFMPYASHVLIRKLESRPKKNDVVLYVHPDGVQLLRRVMGFDGDSGTDRCVGGYH